MATKSTKAKAPDYQGDPEKWQSLLNSMQSGGDFVFIKEGKTRLRLILPPEAESVYEFFREVTNSYGKLKYLVLGVVFYPEESTKVQPIILPKTAMTGILGALAEGYDLFTPETGYGIAVSRTGSGINSEYSSLPSHQPQPISENIEPNETPIDEWAELFMENAQKRQTRRASAPAEPEENTQQQGQSRSQW